MKLKNFFGVLLSLTLMIGLPGMSMEVRAEVTTYNGDVQIGNLKVGDILGSGASITATNWSEYDYTVGLVKDTYKNDGGEIFTYTSYIRLASEGELNNNISVAANGVINSYNIQYQTTQTFYPCGDEKVWYVSQIDISDGDEFSNDPKSVTVELRGTAIPTHEHNFTYTASGATITATCTADGCSLPPTTASGSDHVAKLILVKPTMTTYGQSGEGISEAATLTGLSDFNTATGKNVAATDIKYVGRAGTNYDESTTAPTDAGKYTAKITVENKTASVDYEIATTFPLWVGGVQVTSANASNIDGSNKANYEADTNTLTLNGYSYSGNDCCIKYTDTDDLNLELTGKNTITYTNTQYGIHVPNASLCVSGTGSLILNSQGIGIYNGKNITIQNVTLNIESQANGINCPGNTVTIENSSVTSKGESGISAKDIEISKSTVECSGKSFGIVGTGTITIGSDIISLTVSGKSDATFGTVKNSVAGMGWTTVDGTGEGTEIDVNTSGASLENYKKLLFPYKKPAAIVKTAPTAKSDLIFNGSAQELITPGDKGEGAKEIQYAIGTDSSTAPKEDWSTSIPTATDAGTYYVWYKAIGDESHSDSDANYVTVKIEEKTEAHTHKIVHVEAKEPTCTEDGYEAHYECTECDKWFKDLGGHYLMTETEKTEITKKATGHKWDRGVVTEEATYDETGIKTYTCSVCGETKEETIPVKTRRSSSSSDSSSSDSDSSGGGSSGKSGSISQKSIDVNGNTVQTQPDSGAPLSDRGGNWGNQEYDWTYTKSDGSLAKGEWLNLEYDGHTYWYYFDDSTIMQTNWFDYNGSRYFLVPEMDGWRGRMATGWHMVDNKWYYFDPTIGANQGILLRGMTTPDGRTVGADGAWDGNGTTPIGAVHTGTTVTMN